jgi:alpha-mannosidase
MLSHFRAGNRTRTSDSGLETLPQQKAIQFLELHPYFFRSQYISTQLVRLLKKLKLPAELQSRFDAILAATRERRARRQSRRTRDI